MARIIRFHEIGGPEVLRIENLDVPAPDAGEVRIVVKALGLNRAEALFRAGQYVEEPQLPARLGYEAAGIVEAVGAGVEGIAPGDAVSTIPAFSQNQYGVYGEVAVVPAFAVVKHPPSLSWEEAAASWMQYTTAYGALVQVANLKASDTVLIPAASSSVGLAALQITNLLGATPVALTRGSSKRDALLEAGAAHVVAIAEEDLVARVQEITSGRGARVIFDPVAGPMLAELAAVAKTGGIIIEYGVLSPEPTPFPLREVLRQSLTIRGYTVLEITGNSTHLEEAKAFITYGLASGSLKPIIARTFTLREIVQAHQYLESNEQFGKVVVEVG